MNRLLKRILSAIIAVMIAVFSLTPFCALGASEAELRNKVIEIAQGEVGYKGTSSYSKYGEWYGYQGGWCTIFVLWCYNKTGEAYGVKVNGNAIPNGGNCNSMISWFKSKGTYHNAGDGYSPSVGDLVFFDWSGNGSCQHVGFVKSISGSTVYTIEGNCSGQVKAREYTSNGSKPYNNISAIMGYATPIFSSVTGADSTTTPTTTKATTTKATTTKQVTTKKATTAKKQTTTKKAASTTKAASMTKATTAATTAKPTTTTTTTTKPTTTATTTTEPTTAALESLDIFASNYDLKVGDTVKLEYSVAPSGTNAVVGYFCDEEGIIEIGQAGEITAIGTGTATVVVCANNDLYKQCDFNVTEAVAEVTAVASPETTRKVVDTTSAEVVTTERNIQSVLTRMGVNVNALSQNKQLFLVPAGVIGATAVVSILIAIIKKIKER